MAAGLDQVVHEWEKASPVEYRAESFLLGGVLLGVETDDPGLLGELASILGRPTPEAAPRAERRFAASVRTRGGPESFGHLRLEMGTEALSPADFLLGFASPEFPFHLLESTPPWTEVAFREESVPLFALRDEHCLFRRVTEWRKAVALFLFQRLMRIRNDAIFFHAASVVIRGRGVLFVGPKGAGKSTLALSLAGRGYDLLGDENACYLPAKGEILPFRRPVGIKPGPRSMAVDKALARIGRDPDRDGMMRIDVTDLFPGPAPAPALLGAVVFLEGFAETARLQRIEATRDELGRMQPVGSSLVNASATERVFQMVRMLAGARVYALSPGGPDETAEAVEEELELG